MKKRTQENLLQKQIESEFNVELIPRPLYERRKRLHPDYVSRVRRDENGNHLDKNGDIVLTHVRTQNDKTLTPSEQYRMSEFSPHGRMLRQLRRERQEGSEVGLDKAFEQMLIGHTPAPTPRTIPIPLIECFICQLKKATYEVTKGNKMFNVCKDCLRNI